MAEDIDNAAARAGFAKLWEEILDAEGWAWRARGLNLGTAELLARQVYIGAFYDGARRGAERLKNAVLSATKEGKSC